MNFSPKFISLLRCQPLQRVMEANGHYPKFEQKGQLFYICPFHDDHRPSFIITQQPEGTGVEPFLCRSCGAKGGGALQLQALFMNLAPESEEVIRKVADIFGFTIDEEGKGRSRSAKPCEPQNSYTFNYRPFNDDDLEALGCRRRMVWGRECDDGTLRHVPLLNEQGKPRYKYSWGADFYNDDVTPYVENPDYVNFNPEELTRIFSLRCVESYVTAAVTDAKGAKRSYRITATRSNPVFNFIYRNAGGEWGKKYEPYAKAGGAGTKFIYWYGAGAGRPYLGSMIYGDIDVMNFLETGDVEDIRETKPEGKAEGLFLHVEQIDKEHTRQTKLFHHLVICSGPRDAISIYFHSTAHVVWFNSETTDISYETVALLRRCCENLYICYDIDRTGVEEAERLAMKHLELRIIRLPQALEKFTDQRTGKPCKDAENFFNIYRTDNPYEKVRFYGTIEKLFGTLMNTAVSMKFFAERWRERKSKGGGKEGYITYEISGDSAIQLVGARHIHRYDFDEKKFVYVRCNNNIVDIISEKDIVKTVRQELKAFCERLPEVASYARLRDCITKSGNLDKGTCEQLPVVRLDFKAWDENTEYLPFQNTVIKVTAEKIEKKRFTDMPFHFFRAGVIERDFGAVTEPTFTITRNEELLLRKRKEIDALMYTGMPDAEREVLESRFLEFQRLWEWKLEWLRPYDEQPIAVRLVYETGRVYWQKERRKIPLSPEEKQEQDMHFIAKCNAFGYLLSRHRDPAKPYIVQWVDYSVLTEGKSSGRTGKTALAGLLNCLRKTIVVPGKEMKTGENMALNFAPFRLFVHSNILIDDLRLNLEPESFYNLNTGMQVKTLYEDVTTIPADVAPKMQFTSNKTPDITHSSTRGRFLVLPCGGPIGFHTVNGQVVETSIASFFGCNIPLGLSAEEYNLCQNFLLRCLQFFLREKQIIHPYISADGMARIAAQQINNKDFVEWANEYFADKSRFGVPLARREMFLDWQEYCNRSVSIHGSNMATNEFKQLLRRYCQAFNYPFMPSIVYRGTPSDMKDESVRLSAWVTAKDRNGFRIKPHRWVWSRGERCVYIFESAEQIPIRREDLRQQDKNTPPDATRKDAEQEE